MSTAPFTSAEVVERYRILSEAFRAKGAPVIYIRVDLGDFLELPVDASHHDPNAPPPVPLHRRLHLMPISGR